MTSEPFARLVVSLPSGEKEAYHLSAPSVTVGRSASNDIVLDDARVSRSHARLHVTPQSCAVSDAGSSNGIVFNGRRVPNAVLSSGQSVQLGDTEIRFESLENTPEPETVQLTSMPSLDSMLDEVTADVEITDTNIPRLLQHSPAGTVEHLLEGEATIGRSEENTVVVDDPAASRHHAVIERRGESFVVRDLRSRNGTWLGAERIDEHPLSDGDTLRIGETLLLFKDAYPVESATLLDLPRGRTRHPMLFVPGLLGSELWRGSELLWPNVKHMFRHPEDYFLDDDHPLEARAIVDQVTVVPGLFSIDQYGRLRTFLEENMGYERGKDLFEFPYDWRQDVRISARKLRQFVDELPVDGPLIIVAHSMGSLVSRYYIEYFGGRHRVHRFIAMGGPHRGGPKTIGTLISGIGLGIPFGLLNEGVQRAFSTYPSAYQLLPAYPAVFDHEGNAVNVYEDSDWLSDERHAAFLRTGRELHAQLGLRCSVPSVSIFGFGLRTVTRLNVQRLANGKWRDLTFVERAVGDGTVPESSAILPGSEIHPVRQHHGALYVDTDVKKRLKLELTR